MYLDSEVCSRVSVDFNCVADLNATGEKFRSPSFTPSTKVLNNNYQAKSILRELDGFLNSSLKLVLTYF